MQAIHGIVSLYNYPCSVSDCANCATKRGRWSAFVFYGLSRVVYLVEGNMAQDEYNQKKRTSTDRIPLIMLIIFWRNYYIG